jgi:hypothetical protein
MTTDRKMVIPPLTTNRTSSKKVEYNYKTLRVIHKVLRLSELNHVNDNTSIQRREMARAPEGDKASPQTLHNVRARRIKTIANI